MAISPQALQQRVAALERRVQRLNIALFGCAVAAIVFGSVSAALAGQHMLSFTDSTGSVKLSSAGLGLYDRSGHRRLAITLAGDEPLIALSDARTTRLRLTLGGSHEGGGITFRDSSGDEREYVGLSSDQTGLARMYSSSGSIEASLEDTFLSIRDSKGTEQLSLGVSTANTPLLKMFDQSGTERLYAGVYKDQTVSGGAGFITYNSGGTQTWTAP